MKTEPRRHPWYGTKTNPRKWIKLDEELLLAYHGIGKTPKQLSELLRRSYESIRYKLYKLKEDK